MKIPSVIILSALVLSGCACRTELEMAKARITQLEEKVSVLEDTVELLKPLDMKIDDFLMEHTGMAIGDDISKYPADGPKKCSDGTYNYCIPAKKPFGRFDKAMAFFADGKLFSIWFFGDIDVKIPLDELTPEIARDFSRIATSLRLPSDSYEHPATATNDPFWTIIAPPCKYRCFRLNDDRIVSTRNVRRRGVAFDKIDIRIEWERRRYR